MSNIDNERNTGWKPVSYTHLGGQKAFTVGFEGGAHYDESAYAAELAGELGIEQDVYKRQAS